MWLNFSRNLYKSSKFSRMFAGLAGNPRELLDVSVSNVSQKFPQNLKKSREIFQQLGWKCEKYRYGTLRTGIPVFEIPVYL